MGCKKPRPGSNPTVQAHPVPGRKVTGSDRYAPYGQDQAKWQCPNCGFGNSPLNTVCGGTGPLGCKIPREGMAAGEQVGAAAQVQDQQQANYEALLQVYTPEKIIEMQLETMNQQIAQAQHQNLQTAIARLLRADAQQLQLALGEQYVKQSIEHLRIACVTPVPITVAPPTVPSGPLAARDEPVQQAPVEEEEEEVEDADVPAFVKFVLNFADGQMLGRLCSTSAQWKAWANAAKVWKALVFRLWPGTEELVNAGLDKGDFKALFRERIDLEKGNKLGPAVAAQPLMGGFPISSEERTDLEYFSSYALFVQVADEMGTILSETIDLKLVELEEQGTAIEGFLYQNQGLGSGIPGGIEGFERPVRDIQPKLALSLTAIRRNEAKTCKYNCLCHQVPGPEESQPKDELTFSFSADVPPLLKGLIPRKYMYKCELSELTWGKDADEWNSISPQISGFKRLRLWCERDEEATEAHDEDVSHRRMGCLKILWDAH